MTNKLGERLKKLRRVIQLHVNWFTVSLLGKDAITQEELQDLEVYGKLPLDEDLDYVKISYILGRLKATLKKDEYKDLNYAQVNEQSNSASFTTLEDYALQHIRLHATDGIKALAADVAAGAFDRLKQSTNATLNEASVRGVIKDQLAIAIIEKQNSQKLVSNLVHHLKDGWSRDWRLVAETELHRAKTMGIAQTIVNKIDLYRNGDGADSLVSIVPNIKTCEDCSNHFLDSSGNPKIFRLSQLLDQGSNADEGVKHTRKNGVHNHWKTTLPPLHPRCGCTLVYIPPGMGWELGKLKVVDEDVYIEEIKKAVDLEATVKPKGPESMRANPTTDAAASPPSIPGVAAPGNTPGPGAPSGSGGSAAGSGGPAVEWEYYSGEGQPPSDGGWERSESGAWRRPKGAGGGKASPQEIEASKKALKEEEAKNWNKGGKPAAVVIDHLSNGEISHVRPLQQEDTGSKHVGMGAEFSGTTSIVTIEGNGRGVMKPSRTYSPEVLEGKIYTEGCGTVPHGSDAQNEVDAYGFLTHMFGEGFCPPTTSREHEGQKKSVQQWAEGTKQGLKFVTDNMEPDDRNNPVKPLLRLAADEDKLKEKIGDLIFGDIAMNNNDRHFGNLQIVLNEDGQVVDLLPIDHGPCMANDFMGFKNSLAKAFTSAGFEIKIPDKTLEKSRKTSFGDIKRSMEGKKDWQCAQQLMRMRYIEHIMDTEGYIDYSKLETCIFMATDDPGIPDARMWKGRDGRKHDERKEQRTLSHQQFEDFALDFIDAAASDENHPDHEFAKEWQEKGILMGPGAVIDPEGHRRDGKHKEYEKKVRAERAKKQLDTEATIEETPVTEFEAASTMEAPIEEATAKQGISRTKTTSEILNEQATVDPRKLRKGLYLEDLDKPFRL